MSKSRAELKEEIRKLKAAAEKRPAAAPYEVTIVKGIALVPVKALERAHGEICSLWLKIAGLQAELAALKAAKKR